MYLPLRYKFCSVSFYDQSLSRYKIVESQKCTESPETDLECLTLKNTLYRVITYPRGPNFGLFCSAISGFQDTKNSKLKFHNSFSNFGTDPP